MCFALHLTHKRKIIVKIYYLKASNILIYSNYYYYLYYFNLDFYYFDLIFKKKLKKMGVGTNVKEGVWNLPKSVTYFEWPLRGKFLIRKFVEKPI